MLNDLFPVFANKLYPEIIVRGKADSVYLTFDDGPDPYSTSKLLEMLERESCPATFFVSVSEAEKQMNVIQEMIRNGHSIGSHGYRHRSNLLTSEKVIRQDINKCQEVFSVAQLSPFIYFRPPFGRFNPGMISVSRKLNLRLSLWSLSASDWKNIKARSISDRILNKVKGGDIILLHDRSKNSGEMLKAAPDIIKGIRDKGYTLKSFNSNHFPNEK